MGNYVSCTLAPSIKSSKAARVIFPTGEIRQFRHLVKAAEIMLESPNCFLANSRSLQIGRRFSALSADEDLEFGNVYIVFPMRRVNSVVTAADMAVFFMAANSAAKRLSGGKVSNSQEDESGGGEEMNKEESEGGRLRLTLDGGDDGEGFPVAEYKYRVSMYRSRKPKLETIKEEPTRLR